MSAATFSAQLAAVVVRQLVAHGVRDVVVCPGSRSAPLVYALEQARAAGWVNTHVRVDERSAAFFALGLSKGWRLRDTEDAEVPRSPLGYRPVAVVVTSGTAVANLHPAALEAFHTGVPLVLVSADRPACLRGTGANQTTFQVGLLGPALRSQVDIDWGQVGDFPQAKQKVEQCLSQCLGAALGQGDSPGGPVHVNVCFPDPLVCDELPGLPEKPQFVKVSRDSGVGEPCRPDPHLRTVVVAGDGADLRVGQWASENAIPVLAEPTSGLAAADTAVAHVPAVLAHLGTNVQQVIVSGHPTLSRPVTQLLSRVDLPIFVVAETSLHLNLTGQYRRLSGHELGSQKLPMPPAWGDLWRRASAAAEGVFKANFDEAVVAADYLDPYAVARVISQHFSQDTEESVVFLGASNTIRAFDVAASHPADSGTVYLANRGLAGIDGTISTALGVATSSALPTRVIVGDLTFLHDATGLALGQLEPEADIQVIVLNDGGGAIFSTLEHGDPVRSAVFDRYFLTAQRLNIPALAVGLGLEYIFVDSLYQLRQLLALPARGRTLVEVNTQIPDIRGKRQALRGQLAQEILRVTKN